MFRSICWLLLVCAMLLTRQDSRADIVTGLKILYAFEDRTDLGKDTSGSNNNGTVIKPDLSPANITYTSGTVGAGAASFNDRLGAIANAKPATLGITPIFTTNLWFKLPVLTDPNDFAYTTGMMGFFFTLGYNQWLYVGSYDDDIDGTTPNDQYVWFEGQGGYINTPYPANTTFVNLAGSWKMLTVTYDATASQASVYLDGQLYRQTTTYPSNVVFNTAFLVGNRPGAEGGLVPSTNGTGFKGLMDDVRVYNRVLTSADILELYNLKNTGSQPPTAAQAWELYQ